MSWINCKLSEFCDIAMGQSPPSSSYNEKNDGLAFFQGKSEFGDLYPQIKKYCNKPKKIAGKNDTLLCVRAPVGPTNLAPEKSCIGRGLAAIRAIDAVDYKFIFYLLRSKQVYLSGKGTGTTFKAITKDFLFDLDVAFPSLPEQGQVISLIEQLFSDLDNAIDNLKKAKDQLKVYRQSVLKYAFEGKLNKNCSDFKKAELRTICDPVQNISKSVNPNDSFLYIDIGCINNTANRVVCNKQYLWKEAPSRAKQIIKSGDILFSTVRTYLKNIAMVPEKYDGQIGSTGFCVIRPKKDCLDSQYIFHYVLWDKFINHISTFQTGTSYPAVRDDDVFSQLVPIPDLPSQKLIVNEIESRFSVCDKMEETINNSLEQAEALRQSILKQAFEGKLTEVWRKNHSDLISGENSAKALLERIKKEREAIKNTKKRKK